MVVKFGLSPREKRIGWGCLIIKYSGRYLKLKQTKLQDNGESYIMPSYMCCVLRLKYRNLKRDFPDLWSGQKPWWNWHLTPVVNFREVRRAQLAKSTLIARQLGSFQVLLMSVQMLKREWSAVENGKLLHLINSSKTATLNRYRVCSGGPAFGQNCSLCAWVCSERPAFGQNCSLSAWVCSNRPPLGQNTHGIYRTNLDNFVMYW